jgi:cytochrome o ubiquinol oxidase operon protein cyoD
MTSFRALRSDFLAYGTGYLLSLALTLGAFSVAYYRLAAPEVSLAVILVLGFVQIIVHMRCFLHLSWQRSAQSDLMLVLFSTLIIALMVGGTLIIFFNLRMRMM